MPTMKTEPDFLRVDPFPAEAGEVNTETREVLGYVVAQLGPFKSEGRGQFTMESLEKIVELGNAVPRGLRVRFGHPTLSDDGLGKYLGRAKKFRLDGDKVRADLKLNATAMKEPPQGGRPLGEYVMHLAETDAGGLSSSLVLKTEMRPILDEDGELTGDPPIWMPQELVASDVVDTGDAVDDFLSPEFVQSLPTGTVHTATRLLDEQFKGQSREATENRLQSFLDRYLQHRFGPSTRKEEEMPTDNQNEDRLGNVETQVSELSASVKSLTTLIEEDRKARLAQEAKSDRAAKITALCAMMKLPSEKASEFIADESLSVDGVKDKLLAMKLEAAPPAASEGGKDQDNPQAKLAAEFDANKSVHRRMGVTREAYVEHYGSDDSKAEYMSPEWAEEYRQGLAKEVGLA